MVNAAGGRKDVPMGERDRRARKARHRVTLAPACGIIAALLARVERREADRGPSSA